MPRNLKTRTSPKKRLRYRAFLSTDTTERTEQVRNLNRNELEFVVGNELKCNFFRSQNDSYCLLDTQQDIRKAQEIKDILSNIYFYDFNVIPIVKNIGNNTYFIMRFSPHFDNIFTD